MNGVVHLGFFLLFLLVFFFLTTVDMTDEEQLYYYNKHGNESERNVSSSGSSASSTPHNNDHTIEKNSTGNINGNKLNNINSNPPHPSTTPGAVSPPSPSSGSIDEKRYNTTAPQLADKQYLPSLTFFLYKRHCDQNSSYLKFALLCVNVCNKTLLLGTYFSKWASVLILPYRGKKLV
jgi:hypothetical protein